MSPTIEPIAPWYVVVPFGMLIVGLTLWAYRKKLRGTSGRWRWIALGLRLAAVLMCFLAALKPSLLVMTKIKQQAAILFLLDDSASMGIRDEANNRSRYEAATQALADARKAMQRFQGKIELKTYRFDDRLHADEEPPKTASASKPAEKKAKDDPTGTGTAIGTALDESFKQNPGTKLVAIVPFTDGANNAGPAPLQIAQRLKVQQVPIVPVGFGSETAAAASRDLVARELIAGPVVFVKNQPAIRAVLAARGYANQTVDVELYVEDSKTPVATKQVEVKEANIVLPITDLKWVPQRPGETKLTFRVKPKDGELVQSNNQISTYVSVQSGGIGVLYLAGPGTVWEQKFTTRAIDAATEIQATLRVLRRPVSEDPSALPNEELQPNRYDVVLLGDLPADFLTPLQHRLLKRGVERGGGLMMLGGRSSFGAGGWANSEVASILPTQISATDGQLEPAQGIKMVPSTRALESYVLRIGPTVADSARLWGAMPALPGVNVLGEPKPLANILAIGPNNIPLMVSQEVPPGRVLVFAGETWPWACDFMHEEVQLAHRKFWRQAILWLAHKEDQGAEAVKLTLDRRRVALGQKLELTASARNAKGEPMTDLTYEATIEPVAAVAPGAILKTSAVGMYNQGAEARGPYFPAGPPGEYRATVIARKDGKEIGRDSARFLAYQDDRELENPAADFALLRQLAQVTGGKVLAPEQLAKFIGSIDPNDVTDMVVQKEVRLWDNWPFLLIFALLLTAEWWLRKRNGWV